MISIGVLYWHASNVVFRGAIPFVECNLNLRFMKNVDPVFVNARQFAMQGRCLSIPSLKQYLPNQNNTADIQTNDPCLSWRVSKVSPTFWCTRYLYQHSALSRGQIHCHVYHYNCCRFRPVAKRINMLDKHVKNRWILL